MKKHTFIPLAEPDLTGNEKKYLQKAISSTWISSIGEFIDKFETEFAKYVGKRFAVCSSNGTAALHLALTALGIGPGSEVIVPDLTFIATVNAVSYCGATPVLADINKKGLGISTAQIEKLITKNTKAIIPVHLYGIPCAMEKIMEIAREFKLYVVEDAAEAQGAEVKITQWKKVGSIGDVGCFSFYGNKIMTTGEGGMVVTDDKNLAEKLKILRDHGEDPQRHYFHPLKGFNYRMTNLQAAIGVAQLERIEELLIKKSRISRFYKKYLKNIEGITFPDGDSSTRPVCWLFSILVDAPYRLSRDSLINKLKSHGIDCRPFFIPMHLQPGYQTKRPFPNAVYYSSHGLNLPSAINLKETEIAEISSIISKYTI